MCNRLCVIVYILLTATSLTTYAQKNSPYHSRSPKAIGLFENAIKLYNSRLDDKALDEIRKAIDEDPGFIEAMQLGAEILNTKQDYEGEIALYNQIIHLEPEKHPKIYLYLGEAELNTGRYRDAKTHFSKLAHMKGLDTRSRASLKTLLARADYALRAIETPVPFTLTSIGDSINTSFNEYWPSLTADEQTLLFTREVPALEPDVMGNVKGQEDIFISTRDNGGTWKKASSLGTTVNTQKNEGSQTISSDGRLLVFTACKRPDVIGLCDLYFSERDSSGWNPPVNMSRPINTNAWEAQPCFASDGITLYFASNRPGGKGGMDIWKSTLTESGTWGEPVNLGDSINTPADEMSPFIHPDNHTLYFSSNGHIGMGGQDVFVTKLTNGTWSTPMNLGYPINTYNDEYGLIVSPDGTTALLASNRNTKKGKDLFSFSLYAPVRPSRTSYVKGTVIDAETQADLRADFELTDLESSEMLTRTSSISGTGEFLLCLSPNKHYGLSVSKKGYLFHSEHYNTKGSTDSIKPMNMDISLQSIKVGMKEVLRNIFFDVDSYMLSSQSKSELRNLLKFLSQNPGVIVEIGGHTDLTGKESHNDQLSQLRAHQVYEHLIANGIPSKQLSYKGYGATMPLSTNNNDQSHSLNRRTEFKIIEIQTK